MPKCSPAASRHERALGHSQRRILDFRRQNSSPRYPPQPSTQAVWEKKCRISSVKLKPRRYPLSVPLPLSERILRSPHAVRLAAHKIGCVSCNRLPMGSKQDASHQDERHSHFSGECAGLAKYAGGCNRVARKCRWQTVLNVPGEEPRELDRRYLAVAGTSR